MNKASVLIDVVSTIENQIVNTVEDKQKKMGFTGKDPKQRVKIESASIATTAHIEMWAIVKALHKLRDHFQEQIKADISAMESAQGT